MLQFTTETSKTGTLGEDGSTKRNGAIRVGAQQEYSQTRERESDRKLQPVTDREESETSKGRRLIERIKDDE